MEMFTCFLHVYSNTHVRAPNNYACKFYYYMFRDYSFFLSYSCESLFSSIFSKLIWCGLKQQKNRWNVLQPPFEFPFDFVIRLKIWRECECKCSITNRSGWEKGMLHACLLSMSWGHKWVCRGAQMDKLSSFIMYTVWITRDLYKLIAYYIFQWVSHTKFGHRNQVHAIDTMTWKQKWNWCRVRAPSPFLYLQINITDVDTCKHELCI